MTSLQLTAPFDAVRHALLRAAGPIARPLLVDRGLRVRVVAVGGIAIAAAITVTMPLVLLTAGPLVLGVPHLVADLRYLVVRSRQSLVGALPGIVIAGAGWTVVGAVVAVAGAAAWHRRGAPRWVGLALALFFGLFARSAPFEAALLVAHAHNVVALVIWWRLRPRARWDALVPLSFVAAQALVLYGGADHAFAASASTTFHLGRLVPDIPAPWDLRLLASFALAQSVHYGLWLRAIPDDARDRHTPPTFRASLARLTGDFGSAPLVLAAGAWLAIAAYGVVRPQEALLAYFAIASFHGALEFGALAAGVPGRA